jgi:hypothetical protein
MTLTNAPTCNISHAVITITALTVAGLVLFGVLFTLAWLHTTRRDRETT